MHSHILDQVSLPSTPHPNIYYLLNYAPSPFNGYSYDEDQGGYSLTDRGGVLIDLYAFNKKMY